MRGLTFSFLLFLSAFSAVFAQKYSNEFLAIGVGADAYGMGNAVVASADGVSAAYWNPAGLVGVKSWLEVSAMHSEFFAGIAKYDYVGLAHAVNDRSAVGLSFIRFGVDDIPNTTQLIDNNGVINYDNITTFTAGDYAFLGTYASKLKVEGMSIGGTVKVVYRKVGDFAKAWGFGLDAGWKYQVNKTWRFGVVARDMTSTFNAWVFNLDPEMQQVFLATGNEIPSNGLELTLPRIIMASACQFDLGKKGLNLAAEMDLDLTTDGKRNTLISGAPFSIDPHMGIQFGFRDIVKLRGGISSIQSFSRMDNSTYWGVQPNIGLGISIKGFHLDYAFTRLGDADANFYTHIFSIKFKLAKPKNAMK